MNKLVLSMILLFSGLTFAVTDADKEFDALGGNAAILEKAKAIHPETRTVIVQNRMVSRTKRVEIAPEFSNSFGGSAYNTTQAIGLNAQYHFTPRWSLGAKYTYCFNTLTPEGETAYKQARDDIAKNPDDPRVGVPVIDYPKSEMLALVNWYPIYGKMSLMDKMVAHFDFYLLGGAGQMELNSGSTSTWTGGGGLGVWWTPHLSSRMELRYQTYTAKGLVEEKKMNIAVGSLQVGWLL